MYKKRYKIHNEEGYKAIRIRLAKGSKYLEGHWLDPKYEEATAKYEALAQAALNWEMEHNLIPDFSDKQWEEKWPTAKNNPDVLYGTGL